MTDPERAASVWAQDGMAHTAGGAHSATHLPKLLHTAGAMVFTPLLASRRVRRLVLALVLHTDGVGARLRVRRCRLRCMDACEHSAGGVDQPPRQPARRVEIRRLSRGGSTAGPCKQELLQPQHLGLGARRVQPVQRVEHLRGRVMVTVMWLGVRSWGSGVLRGGGWGSGVGGWVGVG